MPSAPDYDDGEMLPIKLSERQDTLVTTLLVLGTFVLGAAAIFIAANVFYAFGDTILIFFLAWLLAFIVSPIVDPAIVRGPVLPRVVVVLVYVVLFVVIV